MRRVGPILFNTLTVLSLLILMLTVVLWISSYLVPTAVIVWETATERGEVESDRGSISYTKSFTPPRGGPMINFGYDLSLPYPPVAIGAAFLPSIWLYARMRRKHSEHSGRCASCGYDLRATPDRCPECGAAASNANAGKTKAAP